jgi:hypothetical protein
MLTRKVPRPSARGLVGHWPLDNGTADASPYGGHGRLVNGPSWSYGGVRGALRLDGSDDYVRIEHSPALSVGGIGVTAITVAAWYRFESTGTYQNIVTKVAVDGAHTSPYFLYHLGMSNADAPRFFLTVAVAGVPDATPDVVGSTTLVNGTWYHIAGTYDGATLRVFVNGREDGTFSETRDIYTATSPVHIGAHATAGEPAKGLVSDARIYNRTLSAAEILALYRQAPTARRPIVISTAAVTYDTIRPSATASAGSWTAQPSGTLHGVTSDESDSTAARSSAGAGSDTLDLSFPAMGTPDAGTVTFYIRHQRT